MFKRAALLTALAVAGIGAANAAEVIKLYNGTGGPVDGMAITQAASGCALQAYPNDCIGATGGALRFNMISTGFNATAATPAGSFVQNAVIHDVTYGPIFRGGLGAYSNAPYSDSITAGDTLTLTFDSVVQLANVFAWGDHTAPVGSIVINGHDVQHERRLVDRHVQPGCQPHVHVLEWFAGSVLPERHERCSGTGQPRAARPRSDGCGCCAPQARCLISDFSIGWEAAPSGAVSLWFAAGTTSRHVRHPIVTLAHWPNNGKFQRE